MSILAECQSFAYHGLGETRAKSPASSDGPSNNNKGPYPCTWCGYGQMRNLIIDGATKRRHDVTFPCTAEKIVYIFSTGFFQKEIMVYTGVLQIFRTKNR
jgi:hypothetical protein